MSARETDCPCSETMQTSIINLAPVCPHTPQCLGLRLSLCLCLRLRLCLCPCLCLCLCLCLCCYLSLSLSVPVLLSVSVCMRVSYTQLRLLKLAYNHISVIPEDIDTLRALVNLFLPFSFWMCVCVCVCVCVCTHSSALDAWRRRRATPARSRSQTSSLPDCGRGARARSDSRASA